MSAARRCRRVSALAIPHSTGGALRTSATTRRWLYTKIDEIRSSWVAGSRDQSREDVTLPQTRHETGTGHSYKYEYYVKKRM